MRFVYRETVKPQDPTIANTEGVDAGDLADPGDPAINGGEARVEAARDIVVVDLMGRISVWPGYSRRMYQRGAPRKRLAKCMIIPSIYDQLRKSFGLTIRIGDFRVDTGNYIPFGQGARDECLPHTISASGSGQFHISYAPLSSNSKRPVPGAAIT